MPEFKRLTSRLVPLPQTNIDTDQIIPARFLKTSERGDFSQALFADWRFDENGQPKDDFVLNQSQHAGASILLAGDNFGCGSSREHAPWALHDFGFRAVISSRFADIFKSNALKNGLLPVEVSSAYWQQLEHRVSEDDFQVTIDLETCEIQADGLATESFTVEPFARHCLLQGVDTLDYLLAQEAAIVAYESGHPAPIDTRRCL